MNTKCFVIYKSNSNLKTTLAVNKPYLQIEKDNFYVLHPYTFLLTYLTIYNT